LSPPRLFNLHPILISIFKKQTGSSWVVWPIVFVSSVAVFPNSVPWNPGIPRSEISILQANSLQFRTWFIYYYYVNNIQTERSRNRVPMRWIFF
jgi:hypothetical protein